MSGIDQDQGWGHQVASRISESLIQHRPEAPVRPEMIMEAAPPGVLRASRPAWPAVERRQTRMLRKADEAPEAPARPAAASSAVLRPKAAARQHRCERAHVRDVQRPARDNRMRIRCAAGAEEVSGA
jgi:hypothetical protein